MKKPAVVFSTGGTFYGQRPDRSIDWRNGRSKSRDLCWFVRDTDNNIHECSDWHAARELAATLNLQLRALPTKGLSSDTRPVTAIDRD